MTKFSQPVGFGEGIYFGIPNEAYHRDPALSRSGIVKILISDYDFWETSYLNPGTSYSEPKAGSAAEFGTLAEFYLFEPKRFMATYNITGSGKYNDGKRTLNRYLFDDIVQSSRMIRKDPKAAAMISDGMPQVSIFYRHPESGIMLKVRPDWLRPFGAVDLKRLKSIQTSALGWAIHDHGYDIQEKMCIDAILHAKDRLRRIDPKFKIQGAHDRVWLKRFIDDEDAMFRFFFQRSTKPYIYRVEYMSKFIRLKADKRIATGIARYKAAIEQYGVGEWPAGSADAHEFQETNLPMRSFGED